MTAKIYSLQHKETKQPFYVGCTSRTLNERFKEHKYKSISDSIELIEEVSIEDGAKVEIYWIDQFKAWGFELLNKPTGQIYTNYILSRVKHSAKFPKLYSKTEIEGYKKQLQTA